MNKLNVLVVIDSLGSGGAERSTQVLCDYLARVQVPFEIICLDRRSVGVQQDMLSKGYNIHFLDHLNFPKQVNYIASVIQEKAITVVHSVLFRSNLRVRLSKLKAKFVHLESLVNTTYSEQRFLDPKVNKSGLRLYKLIDRFTANRFVDHFHSITDTVKRHYVEQLGIPSNKITVVYRGRDSAKVSPKESMQEFRINKSDFIVVNTGRHEFQKGQVQLLKAFKILIEKGLTDIKLIILGRDGTCTNEMKAYISQNNLGAAVCLAGYRHDVPEILNSCNLFAFSSFYEGLGGAVIEAQAAGLPIACNNIDVLREVVKEGQNAELFDSHDVNSIAKTIEFFYKSPESCTKYGIKSRENFEANFDLEVVHEKMLQLYQKLSKQNSAS
ncbi:glycosyltransferase family 4 protein [Pontibacter rugosus]|uniref:Glycosyltransferase family 4 protein n=1 Tax=Pontibacter rugosus TaxID=1745966 RepID=A0ABW3STG8_9BACT